jgi:hypothetical protein
MKSPPASQPRRQLPPAHPPSPNRALLAASSVALLAWIIFLVLVAWRFI